MASRARRRPSRPSTTFRCRLAARRYHRRHHRAALQPQGDAARARSASPQRPPCSAPPRLRQPPAPRPRMHRRPFNFSELAAGVDETHHVAEGYEADILIRWGDPLFPGMAPVRSGETDRRGAGAPLRLQQRLHRLLPARPAQHARPPVRQPRVREPRGDVRRRRRTAGPQRLRQDHRGTYGGGDGGARRQRAWRLRKQRQMAAGARTAGTIGASPPTPR